MRIAIREILETSGSNLAVIPLGGEWSEPVSDSGRKTLGQFSDVLLDVSSGSLPLKIYPMGGNTKTLSIFPNLEGVIRKPKERIVLTKLGYELHIFPTPHLEKGMHMSVLMRIADIAVQNSGGRLRLTYNEEDESRKSVRHKQHFLKLDEKRIGRNLQVYVFLGDEVIGWQQLLGEFLKEVLLPIKSELPKSYAKASEALRVFGESVYSEHLLWQWRGLF